jgi:hypothetical protein
MIDDEYKTLGDTAPASGQRPSRNENAAVAADGD